ncbi:hypothetical protein ACHHYP_12521 [Achlya hypogyna]|uniref:EF-hand domain-containing protein n=1 Tax=Achlya hypogyna TaxID=1202772 RepID=A0A1V9YGZ9_ACHHY|nr:hypothetical protein ACHHYP_12521 [Achlya hypogyna]
MKRGHEATRSASLLPTAKGAFAAGTPLQTTLSRLEHNDAARKVEPKAFLPEQSHAPPESTQLFNYTNALLHRVTGRYLPASVLGTSQAQLEEVKHLESDPDLVLVIESVRDLTNQFQEVAQAVLAHRKELGKILLKLKGSYVGLFERLLEATMRFYHNYRQDHAKARHDLKHEILRQATTIQEHEETIRVLSHHLEAKEITLQSVRVQVQDLEFQNHTLRSLEETWLALQSEYRELKRYKLDSDKREEQLQQREETIQTKEATLTKHAHFLDVQSKTEHGRIIEEARKYKEAYHKAVEEAKNPPEHAPDSPYYYHSRPQSDAETQTLVDDDGLWDLQDGVPKAARSSVRARLMWRRFHAFVKCKNCHGRPIPNRAFTETDQAYFDVWTVKHKKKRWSRAVAKEWHVPSSIQIFLANLPKSALAMTYYSLPELVTRIDALYDAKYVADAADLADGVAYQQLDQFVAEYYLKRCQGRLQAEAEMYKLLISVKALYLGSAFLHLFARFLHLLDSSESDERRYRYDPDVDEKAQTTKLELNHLGIPPQQALNQSYLRVFLDARHNALNHPELGADHVICTDGYTKWITLDYGIRLLKWYLSYLPEDKVHVYCRQLEYSTGILMHGTITDTKGNQLAVRAQMRFAMLGSEISDGPRRREVVVVNVYVVLEILMDVLLMRTKSIELELAELFRAGDVNNDQVLSFTEFAAIIKPRAPHFNERRLLRMFREALLLGQDQSYAVSIDAFVQVCADHGLVALVSNAAFEFSARSQRRSLKQRRSQTSSRTSPPRRQTTGGLSSREPSISPPKPTQLSVSETSTSGGAPASEEDEDPIDEELMYDSGDEGYSDTVVDGPIEEELEVQG